MTVPKMNALKLAASILICQGVGLAGAIFTRPAIPVWYASLKKPLFNPPPWIFGPVWVALYLFMGVALFLVWRGGFRKPGARAALVLFAVQLFLNALWSPLFFGLRSPAAGLADIVLLLAAACAAAVMFFRLSRAAGVLMLPYATWVAFAAVLNLSIYVLNR